MSTRAATWLLFAGVCIGMPVLFYAFMYMAFVPIVGIPAIMFPHVDTAIFVICAINLVFYGLLYYFICRLIVWTVFAIAGKFAPISVGILALLVASLAFRPIYGGCYAGCDHLSLWGFYADNLHAG